VPKNDYANFNRVQRAAVYRLRKHYETSTKPYPTSSSGRGGGRNASAYAVESDRLRNDMSDFAKEITKQMNNVKRSISQMTRKSADDGNESDDSLFAEDDPKKMKGNKANVALKREGSKPPLGRQTPK
jgi:hypothetical protein